MKHTTTHIDALLEKYWEGTSTLAEEAEIRTYFASNNVAKKHKSIAPMFGYFSEMRSIQTALDVEKIITDVETSEAKGNEKIKSLRLFKMGIAAALVTVFAAVAVIKINLLPKKPANTIVLDEAQDAEEALRITKEALALLSKNINTSSETVNNGVRKVKAANIIKI